MHSDTCHENTDKGLRKRMGVQRAPFLAGEQRSSSEGPHPQAEANRTERTWSSKRKERLAGHSGDSPVAGSEWTQPAVCSELSVPQH